MSSIIHIDDFLSKSKEFPIIDVRSESEFKQGHFPGAINIPILNDEHRKEVGIAYKQKGRQEAVIKGFELAGPKFGDFISQVKNIFSKLPTSNFQLPTILLYCWRGGMRSAIADWILSLAGFQIYRLKGGYKAFRNWTLDVLKQEKKILILGGMTGSGKTEILQHLSKLGETVIDLENLAHHKGSAFGALGQSPQPTTEHFENLLAMLWADASDKNFLWLENESRTIGCNQIPNAIYEQIRKGNVVEINVKRELRIKRILNEYARFPVEQLTELTIKLKKRLGGEHLKESLEYLENRDFENWSKKMLDYYDKSYSYGMMQRENGTIHSINLEGNDYLEFAKQVREFGNSLMKNFTQKVFAL